MTLGRQSFLSRNMLRVNYRRFPVDDRALILSLLQGLGLTTLLHQFPQTEVAPEI